MMDSYLHEPTAMKRIQRVDKGNSHLVELGNLYNAIRPNSDYHIKLLKIMPFHAP